jgi:hypothetical protein
MAGECQSARTEGLVVEEIGDELVVYDLDTDEAHSLDSSAAAIWRACDGTATPPAIAARLNLDDAAVQATLTHLAELDLLTGEAPAVTVTHSRRAVLRRGLVAGAAGAAAIPVIRSIVTPAPAHAQSGGLIPIGEPCTTSSQCVGGCCCSFGSPRTQACEPGIVCGLVAGICVS